MAQEIGVTISYHEGKKFPQMKKKEKKKKKKKRKEVRITITQKSKETRVGMKDGNGISISSL